MSGSDVARPLPPQARASTAVRPSSTLIRLRAFGLPPGRVEMAVWLCRVDTPECGCEQAGEAGPEPMIDLYIDNNVWDLLFDLRLDLCAELPGGEFRILITREGEMEITPIPDRKAELREFIEATIARCGVETDAHFGFRDNSLPLEEQRTAGFGRGRFITKDEGDFAGNTRWRSDDPPRKPEVKLRRNEADIALAARSFRGIVLTRDHKPGALADAHRQGGRVVFLTSFEASGMSLRDFVKAAL